MFTTTDFFADCTTEKEIKKAYYKLAMKHHPDRGGDLRTMQEINDQYDRALQSCDGKTQKTENGKDFKYSYNAEVEGKVKEIIDRLLHLKMDDVNIWLIGVWVWCDGNTKPYKDQIKELGLKWHSKRKAWYFAGRKSKGFRKGAKGLKDIAEDYGCSKFVAKRSGKKAISS